MSDYDKLVTPDASKNPTSTLSTADEETLNLAEGQDQSWKAPREEQPPITSSFSPSESLDGALPSMTQPTTTPSPPLEFSSVERATASNEATVSREEDLAEQKLQTDIESAEDAWRRLGSDTSAVVKSLADTAGVFSKVLAEEMAAADVRAPASEAVASSQKAFESLKKSLVELGEDSGSTAGGSSTLLKDLQSLAESLGEVAGRFAKSAASAASSPSTVDAAKVAQSAFGCAARDVASLARFYSTLLFQRALPPGE